MAHQPRQFLPGMQTVCTSETRIQVLKGLLCQADRLCGQAVGTDHKSPRQAPSSRPAYLPFTEQAAAIKHHAPREYRCPSS